MGTFKASAGFGCLCIHGISLALCLVLTGLIMPDAHRPKRYEKSPLTVFREKQVESRAPRALEKRPVIVPRTEQKAPETRLNDRSGRLQLPDKKRY